jgi:hypothetical protein
MKNQDDPRLNLPSASKFYIISNCPGQQILENSIPAEELRRIKESGDKDGMANRGVRIHRARETGNTLELDAEEVDLYEAGLKCEAALVDLWKEQQIIPAFVEGPREERLWLHDERTLAPLCSGQMDVHYLSPAQANPTKACVLDWKTGFCSNLTGSKGNAQLRLQAVLLAKEHPTLTNIRVGFVKPMFARSELDFCDYSEMDLRYSAESILFDLWRATQEDAPRRAGNHCGYCPCTAHCDQAAAYAMLPSVIALRAARTAGGSFMDAAPYMPKTDLLKVWEMSTVINKIVDVVKARIKAMTAEQLAEIGLELAEGRKLDPITDTKGAIEVLSAQGLPQDSLWACLSLSKTDLGKLLVTHLGVANAKLASEWISLKLDPFITRQQSDKMIKLAK